MISGIRQSTAVQVAHLAGATSRRLGLGSGVAVSGKVLTTLSPSSVEAFSRGRRIVLVSGTNGKSTTTHFLTAAWRAVGPVTSNADGANLMSGIGHALLTADADHLVLEVDELVLPEALRRIRPELAVLLSLSRDQLDRVGEVAQTRRLWHEALRSVPDCHVVANADDPLLVSCVPDTSRATWVGAGLLWREDARACPGCGGPLRLGEGAWSCPNCPFRRPEVAVSREGSVVHLGQRSVALGLQLPGEAAASNATMALAASSWLGVDVAAALPPVQAVSEVSGRFASGSLHGRPVRLLLMKNPASAASVLAVLAATETPVILAFNAEAADGRDPSWLWDVRFDGLRNRTVVVCGRRAEDLSVRLAYAGVPHTSVADLGGAVASLPAGPCDVVATYTAFAAARRQLRC